MTKWIDKLDDEEFKEYEQVMQCYKEKDSKKEEEIMEQLISYTNKYG